MIGLDWSAEFIPREIMISAWAESIPRSSSWVCELYLLIDSKNPSMRPAWRSKSRVLFGVQTDLTQPFCG